LERLDNALIRPGGIDVRVHFGHATRPQDAELFSKFYQNQSQDSELARSFADKVPDNTFSMAHLLEFLMSHKKQSKEAVNSVEERVESHKVGKDASTEGKIEDY
jgi:chaperone BCS1